MSLTSYRAAPPRVTYVSGFCQALVLSWNDLGRFRGPLAAVMGRVLYREDLRHSCIWQTWQRPTLPRLETKYHRRWGVSRPCSEWERVQPPRQNHQVGKRHEC